MKLVHNRLTTFFSNLLNTSDFKRWTQQSNPALLVATAIPNRKLNQKDSTRKSTSLTHKLLRRRYLALTLACTGVLFLILAYTASSLVLTFMGLGLVFWSVLLLYITQSRYIHEDIFIATPLSLIKAIDKIVIDSGYGAGRPVFFYPSNLVGLQQGSLFVSLEEGAKQLPTEEQLLKGRMIHDKPKGLLLGATSSSVVELIENRLNEKISSGDFLSVQEKIPAVLAEELRIVDDISLERKDDHSFSMKMVGGPAVQICRRVSNETKMGNQLGCPMCSAFALIFVKLGGKPIYIKHTLIQDTFVETIYEQIDNSNYEKK